MSGNGSTDSRDATLRRLMRSTPSAHDEGGTGSYATAADDIRRKLDKARVEERRRLSNLGQLRGKCVADSDATSSSSARVGRSFMEASRARAEKDQLQRRTFTLGSQVAGPAPPQSWAESFLHARKQIATQGPTQKKPADLHDARSKRLEVCASVASLFGSGSADTRQDGRPAPQTLADICLSSALSWARRRAGSDIGQELWEVLPSLDSHCKRRLMALCGRGCQLAPLRNSEVEHMWAPSHVALILGVPRGEWEEELESWDQGHSAVSDLMLNDERLHGLTDESQVDLSFASMTISDLSHQLLDCSTGHNVHLRMLSLAGWAFDSNGEVRLESILSNCVNLEALSLAGSTHDLLRPEDSQESDAVVWLTGINRALPKLRSVDVSNCSFFSHAMLRHIALTRTLFPHLRVLDARFTGARATDTNVRKALYARNLNAILT